jgi:hypothetical protein
VSAARDNLMNRTKLILVAFILVLLGGFSSVRGEVISDRVAAVVNGDVIFE